MLGSRQLGTVCELTARSWFWQRARRRSLAPQQIRRHSVLALDSLSLIPPHTNPHRDTRRTADPSQHAVDLHLYASFILLTPTPSSYQSPFPSTAHLQVRSDARPLPARASLAAIGRHSHCRGPPTLLSTIPCARSSLCLRPLPDHRDCYLAMAIHAALPKHLQKASPSHPHQLGRTCCFARPILPHQHAGAVGNVHR